MTSFDLSQYLEEYQIRETKKIKVSFQCIREYWPKVEGYELLGITKAFKDRQETKFIFEPVTDRQYQYMKGEIIRLYKEGFDRLEFRLKSPQGAIFHEIYQMSDLIYHDRT